MYSPPFYDTEIVDGLGLLNARYRARCFWSEFAWDPLIYGSYIHYKNHPAPTREIFLQDYLENGLEFYVYLTMESLYVTYDFIKEHDTFLLQLRCPKNIVIKCRIIDPPNKQIKKHQIVSPWTSYGSFPGLALPIYLRIEREELNQLQEVFNDDNYNMNTLLLSLKYTYPLEKKNVRKTINDVEYVDVESTGHLGTLWYENLFTLREKVPDVIRVLVASDFHVAERNKKYLGESPPAGAYCDFNQQAERLKIKVKEHWKKGEIDYAVFCGDLIDFALKDDALERNSDDARINLFPSPEFKDDPLPYGLGGYFYSLTQLVYRATHGTEEEREQARMIARSSENLHKIMKVLEKLGNPEFSNWQMFNDIFKDMTVCVPTYMVPGNHDRIVFGYDLLGMNEAKFNQFVDAILSPTEEFFLAWGWAFALGTLGLSTVIIPSEEGPPEFEPTHHFAHIGLTESQAADFDTGRNIQSNYRTLLAAFHAREALGGIGIVDNATFTNTLADSSLLLKHTKGNIRLAFFDSGPAWNLVNNTTPWCRGFPEPRKGVHPQIDRLKKWRDDDAHKDETLILFMHSGPFSVFGTSHAGPVGTDYLIFSAPHPENDTDEEHRHFVYMNDNLFYGTFYHSLREMLWILAPRLKMGDGTTGHSHTPDYDFQPETRLERERPVLVFAGHTHWRHTYSLLHNVYRDWNDQITVPILYHIGSLRCVHYEFGNSILETLNSLGSLEAARIWWRHRSLVVNTGCVGPIPGLDYDENIGTGGWPVSRPEDSQGYYVMTIEEGVVTRIEWKSLFYLG
jgi:hypothetical protein